MVEALALRPAVAAAEIVSAGPVRPGRQIGIHYTGFAAVRTPQPYAWQYLFGPAPAEALRVFLARVGFAPAEIKARGPLALGDVAVLARMPADAGAAFEPGKIMPLAFVAEGLTADEINEAARELMRQGWRP